jgi:peptidoglycan/LPS O-acetylase OafA/YrhL
VACHFGYAGLLLDLALAVFVMATALGQPWAGVRRVLGWRPLQSLGRYSFALYLWHYPIFWYLSRNAADWSWEGRAVVGIGLSMLIALVSQWLIERPLQRSLAGARWQVATDRGLVGAAVVLGRQQLSSLRSRSGSDTPATPGPVAGAEDDSPGHGPDLHAHGTGS